MEIKIDTKKDSIEDIKKTVDFLLKFVGEADKIVDDTPIVGEGAFNLFGNDEDNDNNSSTMTPNSDDSNDDEEPKISIEEY